MKVTDEMVEKAARAMCEAADDNWDWSVFYIVDANDTAETAQNLYREMARAALEATLSARVRGVAVPEGWQLVPKEPTTEMLKSVWSLHHANGREIASVIYEALLAAAPKQEE